MRKIATVLGFLVALLSVPARAQTVQDFARLGSESESVIRGVGLVMGLPGTGDSDDSYAMIESLLEVLRNSGVEAQIPEDLGETNSVALVMVTATIGPAGARVGDEVDIDVAVVGNASSLRGGRLFLTPLVGPFPGDPIYAMAQGRIELDTADVPTLGSVRNGATITQDIKTSAPNGTLSLRIMPEVEGWRTATEMADRINQEWFGTTQTFGEDVAVAVDNRTVRLIVPEDQREEIPVFLADVLATPVNPANFALPAVVRVNRRTGAIIASADVSIGAVAITHRDLVITTTVPEPVPTPAEPLVERTSVASLGTEPSPRETARLADLAAAFNQLDVPADQRVEILQMLHKQGKLYARLIIEGSDG